MSGARFSEEWLRGLKDKGLKTNDKFVKPTSAPVEDKPKRNGKFNAIKVEDPEGGKIIDSKIEAAHVAVFRREMREGKIFCYSRQVEFWLPSMDAKYIADHGWFDPSGQYHVADSKGMQTADFKLKWKAVQKQHPEIRFHLLTEKKFKGVETL